jgi:hypothetical protein
VRGGRPYSRSAKCPSSSSFFRGAAVVMVVCSDLASVALPASCRQSHNWARPVCEADVSRSPCFAMAHVGTAHFCNGCNPSAERRRTTTRSVADGEAAPVSTMLTATRSSTRGSSWEYRDKPGSFGCVMTARARVATIATTILAPARLWSSTLCVDQPTTLVAPSEDSGIDAQGHGEVTTGSGRGDDCLG